MVGSNGRFLLGVLLGALVGAGLYHLSTGSQPIYADPSVGLERGGALEPPGDDRPSAAPLALPRTEPAALRAEGSTEPASVAPLSESELASLVDGVAGTRAAAETGAGAMWGRVVDEDGAGLEGVVLRLTRRVRASSATPAASVGAAAPELDTLEDAVRAAAERFREARAHLREVRTDAGGTYRFEGLGDGPWSVEAYLDGYEVSADGGAWELPVGSEVDFTASRVVEVPVTVFEPGGALATGARFGCKETNGNPRTVRYGWTAAESYLRLTPGSYELTAYSDDGSSTQDATRTSEPQEVRVTAGDAPAPLRFELQTRLAIRGVIKAPKDGVQASNYAVRLLPLSPQQDVDLEVLANSDRMEWSRPGREFAFTDLEAGRYVVGVSRSWRAPIEVHEVVELGAESLRLTLEMPPLDRSRYLTVVVLSPEGALVDDVNLSVGVKTGSRSGTTGVQELRDEDGAYLVSFEDERLRGYFDESEPTGEYTLHLRHEELGSREVPLVRGQSDVSVTFAVPGTLEVTVAGYQGSGYEGRLSVSAAKQGADTRRVSFLGSGRNSMSAEGVQKIDGLEPGRYVVSLNVRPKGSGRFSGATTIDRAELEVLAGENTLQMSIPVLYSVRVHWADGKEGANFSMRPKEDTDPFGFGGAQAQIDAEGFATFKELRAGEYVLSTWGGSAQQMHVTVPSKEIEFVPMAIDALRVAITDPSGDLAKVGFRDGDLIIGVDGEEFTDTPDFRVFGRLQTSKAAELSFLVQRGGKTLELVVTGAEVGDWSDMGGQLLPDQR